MNYTKEQEQAVFLRNQNIMISAGAGAGKTRVLVNRMAELIMDKKHPVDASRFLVMTFTNAAAAEMKERIGAELEKRLDEEPDNRYLKQQIRKIRQADISTVHSFCNHLIRMHYSELDIDPAFRIGEEGELFLLKRQAMEELLEEAYQSGRQSFRDFVESQAPGKSDEIIEDMIGEMYRFLRGFPNAELWSEQTKKEAKAMAEAKDFSESPAVKLLIRTAKEEAAALYEQAEQISDLMTDGLSPEKYMELYSEICRILRKLMDSGSYDEYYGTLRKEPVPSFPRAAKAEKEWDGYEVIRGLHQKVKAALEKQREEIFTAPADELQKDAAGMYPLLEEYLFLAKRFGEIYFARKKEKNVYDFDDLEHLALALLVDSYDENGKAQPSDTAKALAKKYRMIFVDEYQDTNLVQETILTMIADPSENELFTVGDVKQSIYRFRQARPDLFLQRMQGYEASSKTGICIELRDNFRSAPGVLAFTNYIFSRLMEKDFGGVDYDEKNCLRPGGGGPMEKDEETSEVLYFVKDADGLADDLLLECAVIAKRIRALTGEGYTYGDIVILLRSGAGKMEPMAEFLEKAGIPVSCENKTGYFHTREITIMMNYLSVVDNVYQDIPMASVMLSPIGGFTEDELAKLRVLISAPNRADYTFYDLMRLYLTEGKEEALQEKIRRFLKQLLYFRQKKKEMPLGTLLWEIYEKTGFYYHVQLMPDGERRKENLLMLLQKAEDYEKTVFKGLFYFIRYMEQLRSYEIEMGGAGNGEEAEDVVRIMTIHKSKGLEFPVVFVSGLSRKFNRMDLNKSVLCHPDMGIGMECTDMALRVHHPSVMKKAIREKLKKDSAEEEMRILYVAMTRAQRKLILTGVVKDDELETMKRTNIRTEKRRAVSFSDWVIPALSDCFSGEKPSWLTMKFARWPEIEDLFSQEKDEANPFSAEQFMREIAAEDAAPVEKSFSFEYPDREAIGWKRKYSVSELKSLSQTVLPDEEIPEIHGEILPEEDIPVPEFLKETKELQPTARGTIVHKVMELLPYGQIETKKDLFDSLKALEETYPEMKKVSGKWLYKGAESFLFCREGEEIRRADREKRLYRELPFTVGLPVSMIDPNASGEDMVVVQGIIDACGLFDDGIWLLDYKTDRIGEGEESLLLDRYRNQMLYYKAALEQITEKKVSQIYIYSFALQKYIRCRLPEFA